MLFCVSVLWLIQMASRLRIFHASVWHSSLSYHITGQGGKQKKGLMPCCSNPVTCSDPIRLQPHMSLQVAEEAFGTEVNARWVDGYCDYARLVAAQGRRVWFWISYFWRQPAAYISLWRPKKFMLIILLTTKELAFLCDTGTRHWREGIAWGSS